MATLWEIVTGNSTLPVQAGNTFWDHLNNQAGGGGGGPTQLLVIEAFAENIENEVDVLVGSVEVDVEIDGVSVEVVVDDDGVVTK